MEGSGLYLQALQGSLSPDKEVRKNAELHLSQLEQNGDFLHVLLGIARSRDVEKGIRTNAAIYFKNKITHTWISLDPQDPVKALLRELLCEGIYSTHDDSNLQNQLTVALYKILVVDEWPELCDVALRYLNSSSVADVHTGVLLVFQLIKSKRWSRTDDRALLEQYCFKVMPQLTQLVEGFSKQFNSDDKASGEILYLILKIFKYATFLELPQYFSTLDKLSQWVKIQLDIISSPLPQYLVLLDDDEKVRDYRIKAVKWCYANIHRLQLKYGGGIDKKQRETELAKNFNTHFVPVILNCYWKEISDWSNSLKYISESGLYHMISFLEGCCSVDETWNLIYEKFDAILRHLVFKSLCATDFTLELFEDDPEEYYRRYLDTNKDVNTSDIAAINFIFNLCFKRFPQIIEQVLSLLNEVFSKRASNFDDLSVAKEVEGALRILSSISFKIVKKSSPVAHQIDQIINSFIAPELSDQNKYGFLKARACDVIASFTYTYQDMQVLSLVCQGCMSCFQNNDSLPIQITSADALGTLISEKEVELAISQHVTSIMERLLQLSNNYEFDVINSIMDDFVEKFSVQLEPFSTQIASNLNDQLIKIGSELLDSGNLTTGADEVDKEYQAIGILNTMMTMLLSMNSSKEITLRLLETILPSIKFLLDNAMINFINEIMELLESCNVTIKEISPLMWEFFQLTLGSFDTYGEEFFDVYVPFWESCINYGFSDKSNNDTQFVLLMNVITKNLMDENRFDSSITELSLELLYKTVLTVKNLENYLPELLRLSTTSYFKVAEEFGKEVVKPYLKLILSCLYKYPVETLKFFKDEELLSILQLWFQNDEIFVTAFDLKLQVMLIITIFKVKYSGIEVSQTIDKADTMLKSKLVEILVKLPKVISRQEEILREQTGVRKDIEEYENGDDFLNDQDYEYDSEEADIFKDILFDHLNVYEEFINGFLKQDNNYNYFVQSVDNQEVIQFVNRCMSAA